MARLRVHHRDDPCWFGTGRLLQNRIQECHQFGRSQDSPNPDAARAPCLDHRPPAQPPPAVTAGWRPGRPRALRWQGVLATGTPPARHRLVCLQPRVGLQVLAGSRALAEPDRARPQHAPQLAGAGQVTPVPRAQREVLMVVMPEASTGPAVPPGRAVARAGSGESVVGVRPGRRLLGIQPGRRHALGEPG